MALVRVEFIVSGRVQKVGYRYFVRLKAYDRDITGRVENLGDGTVRIVAEGGREEIQKFRGDIDIQQGSISVKEVRQVGEEEIGERAHRDFAIGRTRVENALGISDKLDLGIYYLRTMDDRIGKVEEHVVSAEENISSSIKTFQDATVACFQGLDEKYGKVSQYLEETSNHLAEISKTNQKTAEHLAHLTELVGKIAEEKAQRK